MRGRDFKISLVILLAVFLGSAFLVSRVFVYDTNVAHPGLTKLAAELYNQQAGKKLTNQEINWLQQGAIDEDYPLRWMNHFYDPIHNRGFKGAYDTAKQWAKNPQNQSDFSLGDQSWQRAMYEYQQGNKKQAFIALGHVLHLLEDMTVPAHTRDDAHVGGDPYESWVKENFKLVSSQPIYFSNLNQHFDYLANYSNRYFYSEDTIEDKKFNIIIPIKSDLVSLNTGEFIKYVYNLSPEGKEYKLYWEEVQGEWKSQTKNNIINRSVGDLGILSDHFSLLAPKAVGAGAGVIKLFFEEAAKQKAEKPVENQTSFWGYAQQPVGWLIKNAEPLADKAKNLIFNFGNLTAKAEFVSELFKDSLAVAQGVPSIASQEILSAVDSLSQAADLPSIVNQPPLTQPEMPVNSPPNPPPKPPSPPPLPPLSKPPLIQPANSANQEPREDLLAGFVKTPSITTPFSPPSKGGDNKAVPLPATQPIVYGGSSYSSVSSAPSPTPTTPTPPPASLAGGSQGGDKTPPPPPPPDTTPPVAPIFFQPLTSLVWTTQATTTLSAELSSDAYKIFLNNTEKIVSSTLWSQEVELAEGENIFELTAADLAGNVSATSTVKIVKDTTSPVSSITTTIKPSNHLTINLSWSGDDKAGSGTNAFDVEFQKSEIGSASSSEWLAWQTSTTSTQAIFSGETGYQYQFKVRANDQLGNLGEWAMSEVQKIDLPRIVINEIAWAGTKANANDEWLELYNLEDYQVDLSGWQLTDSQDINFVFSSSSLIVAHGFYLLERINDETIKSILADAIYTGSLNNSGENLLLKDQKGRLMDEVRAGNGWFAGSLGSDKQSMERKDPLVSGNLASNWQSTPANPRNGWDAKANPINGTPKRPNSPFIFLEGTLTSNRLLTADLNPYFLDAYTVASGTILTIGPGVVIKAGTGGIWVGGGNLLVYGKVQSQGTSEAPVVFTSYRDSSYAGNTNTWDSATTAGPGEWEHLIFYPGSQADLQNTKILYGNFRSRENDPNGALVIEKAEANLSGLTVSYVRPYFGETAINLNNASTTISQSFITDNPVGLLVKGGAVNLTSSLFENNGTGLDVSQGVNLTIKDNIFKSNGFKSGGLGPASISNSRLTSANNQFQNNSVNGLEWSGNIIGEQVIDNSLDAPWVSSGFTVPSGSVLTIKAGSRFKMKFNSFVGINGALIVEGTESQPVVFTSYHDDSDGYDSDNLSQPPNPMAGEWYQLRFDSLAASTLNYLNVHYANQRSYLSDPAGSLYINQTPVLADHLQIRYSRSTDVALHLKNAHQAVITNSLIKNDAKPPFNPYGYSIGILIDSGAPVISDTTIDTFYYGIMRQNNPQEQLMNIKYVEVDWRGD